CANRTASAGVRHVACFLPLQRSAQSDRRPYPGDERNEHDTRFTAKAADAPDPVAPRRRREGDDVMRLPTWPANALWNQLSQFQHEMNRLFDRWGPAAPTAAAAFPPVNVREEDDAVVLEAELPGLELKDLEIFVTGGNQLTLKGE